MHLEPAYQLILDGEIDADTKLTWCCDTNCLMEVDRNEHPDCQGWKSLWSSRKV